MTKEEMKTLIAEKISGQGNQVDIGGALPMILGEIIDAIPTTGLQFGGVLSDGSTIPETPNMFYVAGAGDYQTDEEETQEFVIADGSIAFFIVNAQGEATVQTIEITPGGGSGAPVLKITVQDESFNNIAFTGLASSVPSRTVHFAVEGQTVQSVSLQNTADADDYIDATTDGEGGFVATIPGKTATYFVEAVLADNSVVSGVLFMNKATE